ncbi:unnamed protein product, partial [Staurois parvus]
MCVFVICSRCWVPVLNLGCVWLPNTAASTATLRHVPLSSAHAADGFLPLFKLVLCMSSEYCCLHRHPAPCATFGSPHTAARSRVCHGSLYGLPLLLTSSPDSAMCHFQVSLHCWWVPFCDRVL